MNKSFILILAALPLILASCATPPSPPVAFHKTDNTMLVIDSWDGRLCQMVHPTVSAKEEYDKLLPQAKALQPRQTAVVILENYNEPQVGQQFRDRGVQWFVELRGLGYEHIYFLQGRGVTDPEGLPTIARYD